MGEPKSNRELCYYPVQSARKLPLSINDPGNSMSPSYAPVDSTSNPTPLSYAPAPFGYMYHEEQDGINWER